MIEEIREPVRYFIGKAESKRFGNAIFISRGGEKWMRLPSRRDHFWKHAQAATAGLCDDLEPGDWISFVTTCTACERACYEESPLEFLPTSVFYSVTSIS